jgi:hypothetical protein
VLVELEEIDTKSLEIYSREGRLNPILLVLAFFGLRTIKGTSNICESLSDSEASLRSQNNRYWRNNLGSWRLKWNIKDIPCPKHI